MASRKTVCVKSVVLGDSGVGKTSLLRRLMSNTFVYKYNTTIGCEILTKNVIMYEQPLLLQVFDTAGQTRFQPKSLSFYGEADCCVLVFDVSRPDTFRSLDRWREEFILQACPELSENVPLVVIGNKADVVSRRVSARLARDWCRLHGDATYFETSSRDDDYEEIERMFKVVTKAALVYKTGDESSGFRPSENQRLETRHVIRLRSKLWLLIAVFMFGFLLYLAYQMK